MTNQTTNTGIAYRRMNELLKVSGLRVRARHAGTASRQAKTQLRSA